ncbi:cytochrome c oxidase subunit II [Psychroflexus gondwanensis]|jgi:cytochrome c oxidase subunit 2|uniref:cytochrome-c oxidase n=1 Tax=Psychroflexus gondwanensis ACAM 44 TaxID=1189619 RepID=N1WVV1_9FLAO|nr:cytochrome c oxidase subunit II [Psychroflexus gondwanensis]EMY81254.1 cytochrome c oxidase subunit II [Psychroflexus gondwanensis ACAM 44]TXE18165.1 cytochrome c oxidase subunit II [Psychroflexus gondwanensis]
MIALLIIIVAALLGITIWQISKIFKLSQPIESDDSQIATNKDNEKQGKLFLVFIVFLYGLMFYSFWSLSKFYVPAASDHAEDYDQLFFISIGLIMFVQVIIQFILYWFAYKYRGQKGRKALFYADNDKLEFVWTIIPVITLSALIIYGLFSWSEIMNVEETDDTLVVEIYAYQFAWRARYSGEDRTLGEANVRFIEGINQLGVSETDPYAKDDIITTELHLPVNRPVLFKFRSQDVLHSAYFPFFRSQMNVVPGMTTQFGFTPSITSKEIRNSDYMVDKVRNINEIRENNDNLGPDEKNYEFEYYLLCNKICGVSHYNMQMKIVVETEEEYQKWISEQQTFGELTAKN